MNNIKGEINVDVYSNINKLRQNRKYKIIVESEGKTLFFDSSNLIEDTNMITFVDKFGKCLSFNKKYNIVY